MNMLEALTIVRNASIVSAQMRTKRGQSALKAIDTKLQKLARKKAWRDGNGAVPIHMAAPAFVYRIEDVQTEALRKAEAQLVFWLEHARQGDMVSGVMATMDVLTAIRAALPEDPEGAPATVQMHIGPVPLEQPADRS